MEQEAERGERCRYCFDFSSDLAPCMFCHPVTGQAREAVIVPRPPDARGPQGTARTGERGFTASASSAEIPAAPPGNSSGSSSSSSAPTSGVGGCPLGSRAEHGHGAASTRWQDAGALVSIGGQFLSSAADTCSVCLAVVPRPSWASMLACEVCREPACADCLMIDPGGEDGPVEFLCPGCRQSRRQQGLTAELEALFKDLRDTRVDEALVLELSEIVGCSQAVAQSLLTEHQGNLEGAVRHHVAMESRREGESGGGGASPATHP